MFHMVKFSGMETVAVVPAEWYNAGQTLWPNYKTDKCMERAVQRRETPGEDWDRYNCTVLKTYDNYSAAHQALKSLSCSTSDVQSDEGEEVNAKTKPIHYIGESDVDSDQNESRTPLKKQRTHQKVHRFPSSSTQTVVPPTKPHTMSSKMTPPLLAPPASVIPCPEMNTSSWEGQLLFHPTCRVRTGTGPILCTAAQLHMLTLMEQVKHEQNQILGMLNGLNTKLDANTELQSFFDTPEDLKFPLDTIEDVEHFEAWLAEATNAGSKNNLIKILSTLGGQDVKKVTWNILAHIFSDNVSKKICWKGANQKLKFSGMNTKGLLIRAVRNCKVSSNATEEEISKHAIRWFNLASDRGGGRKERHRLSTAGRTTDEQNSE